MMILLEDAGEVMSYVGKWITFALAVIAFLSLVASAVLIIFSKRREDLLKLANERADSGEKLLKLKEMETADAARKLTVEIESHVKTRAEFDLIRSEYKAIVGINLGELMRYWEEKEETGIKIVSLESEIRVKNRLIEKLELERINK